MNHKPMETAFAPAERATAEVVEQQAEIVCRQPLAQHVVNGMPHAVMVLNKYRQAVMVNAALLGLVQKPLMQILGQRPGEALGCVNSDKTPGGCGTTESCRDCGAVLAILAAQEGQTAEGECCVRLDAKGLGADLDLHVRTSPMEVEGEPYVLVCATDISSQKRRRSLERIFFHDVLNTVGNLSGFAHLLNAPNNKDQAIHASLIEQAANKLVEEISLQKDLMAAETGDLGVSPFTCMSLSILNQCVNSSLGHSTGSEGRIVIDPASENMEMVTDPVLLGRVLINMLKNALEASPDGGPVTTGCRKVDGRVRFWVHNTGYIPEENQEFIFHRSFSTKSPERGLGTYSMHLLTTRYLQGSVGFDSDSDAGTVFYAELPEMLQ